MKRKFLRMLETGIMMCCLTVSGALAAGAQTALAAEKPQITMADIIQANETDSILNHYDSMLLEVSGENNYVCYAEKEFNYFENEVQKFIDTPEGIYFYAEETGYIGLIPLGQRLADFQKTNSYYVLNKEFSAWEEIQDIQTEGDTLIVTTSLDTEKVQEYSQLAGNEYQEGDTGICVYWLEPDTLLLKKSSSMILHSDGSTGEESIDVMSYNIQCPEDAAAMRARLEDKENTRTVTLIENPGTDQEVSYRATVQKGEDVQTSPGEADTVEIYLDPECTEEYSGGADTSQDLTYYIIVK